MKSTPQELSNDMSHDAQSLLQQKLGIDTFWKKKSETAISREAKMEKTRDKAFFDIQLERNQLMHVEKCKYKTFFR